MSDLVVLLTGGGTGVGLETVKQLLGQTTTTRVSVLTLAVTPELKALEGNFGSGRLLIVEGDATVDGTNNRAVGETVKQFGYINSLICCIGTMQPVQAVRDLDMAQHRRIFEINYFATVEIVTLCIPILLDAASKHGRKATVGIATSNADWERVLRGLCGYCDSKAALSRFIKVLAHEERDIHTVGLYPGVTHTPMVDLILDGAYTDVMYPEETAWYTDMKTNKWHRPGGIELPELPARALVKIACGNIAGIESGDIRTWEGFQLD